MPRGRREDGHHENVMHAPERVQRRIVTPLRLLLQTVELHDMVTFLQRIKVRFTLRGGHKGERDPERSKGNPYHYEARIIVQSYEHGSRTLRTYKAGGKGPAHALADALAEFLTLEEFDFQDYAAGEVSDPAIDGLRIDADDDRPAGDDAQEERDREDTKEAEDDT